MSHTSEFSRYPERGRTFVDAAKDSIARLEHVPIEMGYFPASDQTPASTCQERVRGADVYLGILGVRYGTPVVDRPEVSYTELEFECATEQQLPRLLFLLDDAASGHGIPISGLFDDAPERQRRFREHASASGLIVSRFGDVSELSLCVERALRELDRGRRAQSSDDLFVARYYENIGQWLPIGKEESVLSRFDTFDEHLRSLPADTRVVTQQVNTEAYLRRFGLRLTHLKEKLALLGYLVNDGSNEYDDSVPQALLRFQRDSFMRYQDGMFGELTYRAMITALRERG